MANTLLMRKHNSTEDENYDFYQLIINEPAFWLSLAVVGFVMSAVIFIANFLLLLTIYKDPRRSLRTPPCFLIANLGASDLLLGLIAVFLVALRDVYRYLQVPMPSPGVYKAVIYTVVCTTLFVSSANIIAMSSTCYVAINDPIDYKIIITKKRIRIFIALLWVVSILMSFLPATNVSEKVFMLLYLHTHATLPAILLTVIYIKVFRALARRTQEGRQFQLSGRNSIVRSIHALQRERTMLFMTVIVLGMFYITFIPQLITFHLHFFCTSCQQSLTFHKFHVVSSRFLFLNSAINPFIYAWRVPKYRRAFIDYWKILRNKFRLCSTQAVEPLSLSRQRQFTRENHFNSEQAKQEYQRKSDSLAL